LVKTPGALVVHAGDQGGALTNGANHTGSVYVGDLDAWTFTAAKDDDIVLSVGEVLQSEIDPLFQPWIRLIGPTGTLITQAQGALAAQIATNAVLTVPNGDEGGPMLSGANSQGVITVGDLDAYTFTAAQGDYIAIKIGEIVLSEVDPLFVPWIRLLGPTGTLVSQGAGNLTATIATSAPLSGTYTILVTDSAISREPSHEGTYLLTVFKTPGTFVVPSGDQGGTLLNNVTRGGTIYSGDLDEWTFTATSTHALTLTITDVNNDAGFIPWIRLIGPTGTVVSQAAGVTTATINIASLPATGLYTVIVSDSDISREGSGIGTYTLNAIGVDPTVCDTNALAGVTTIRALDVTSLRDRINNVRVHFGLPSFTFTDSDLTGAPIKAIHFLELRSALQDAYTAAGQPVPTYTDSTLTPQLTFIKAVHINQVCAAVAFLESN